MSLSIAYENLEDAVMRLGGTLVLYDNEPVYIQHITAAEPGDPKEDIFRVYAASLPFNGGRKGGELLRKFISSRKFDLAPFPMGFMNYDHDVFYCSRQPRRQQRQGLSQQTFLSECVSRPRRDGMRLDGAVTFKEFVACIKGDYPSFEEVLQQIENKEAVCGAFSRTFAVVCDEDIDELLYLFYKKEKVGFFMEGELKLSKKGLCLKESLREVGVKC